MPTFREQIRSYIDGHWSVPCADGKVWVFYQAIDTPSEIAKYKRTSGRDWAAAFLQYGDTTYGSLEGLYLVPPSDVSKVLEGHLSAADYPERKMLSSWFDNSSKSSANAEVLAQKPPYYGLNDCAHFVTQSLGAGGIHVETTGVPTLFNSLRSLPDTKTLAKTVAAATAKPIVDAGLMKPGDVIIFSKGAEHHHSTVYVGGGKIAMQTWANHPKNPTLHGDWTASATDDHPLVTLIHFGRDDAPIAMDSDMLGWWKVTWRGASYYYYFDKHGWVGWTQQPPANLKQPMMSPRGRGYWFEEATRVRICWTDTGSLEVFALNPSAAATHLDGTWNGAEPLSADKMVGATRP